MFAVLASRVQFFLIPALLALLALALTLGGDRTPVPRARPNIVVKAAPPPRQALEPPPEIEPLELRELTRDDARAFNATIPFAAGRNLPAHPFIFAGSAADRRIGTACLAAVNWYEAGDDKIGQQAVVQVVLNRLRHPAYPKSICGVVFQGSERRTGCQFTFSCDGSQVRVPSADAWRRAVEIAEAALAGFVFKPVGTATHYHTDWVVPYWSASLDKVTAIHTHLFFRWQGWWGERGAFTGRYLGGESMERRFAWLTGGEPAQAGGDIPEGIFVSTDSDAAADGPAAPPSGVPASVLKANVLRLSDPAASMFALQLDPGAFPGSYAIVAFALCRDRPFCVVAGWLSADKVPRALPLAPAMLRAASFVFRKPGGTGAGVALWNCRQIARENKAQCLPGTE